MRDSHNRRFDEAVARRDEDALARHCNGLVSAAVAKLTPAPPLDWDDLRAIARFGVIEALRSYAGAPEQFPAYAVTVARRRAVDAIRRAAGRRGHKLVPTLSLQWRDSDEGGEFALQLPDRGPGPHELAVLREALAHLHLIPRAQAEALVCGLAGVTHRHDLAQVTHAKNSIIRGYLTPEHRVRTGHIYVSRDIHPTEQGATAEALRVRPHATVLGVSKRKLRGGRECAPQGRADADGRLGLAVWRVELEERVGAPLAA